MPVHQILCQSFLWSPDNSYVEEKKSLDHNIPIPNIILHLKCKLNEINNNYAITYNPCIENISNYNIEDKNFLYFNYSPIKHLNIKFMEQLGTYFCCFSSFVFIVCDQDFMVYLVYDILWSSLSLYKFFLGNKLLGNFFSN